VHEPSEDEIDDSKDSIYEELQRNFYHFPKYLMKIVLDFIAKLERENILNRQVGMNVYIRTVMIICLIIVNFAIPKNLVVNSTMFPHRNFHNYIWTPPDWQTHNQIDYILIGRRWHSSILNVRRFKGTDCGNDQFRVVAKDTERMAVTKRATQKFGGERLNLRKLNHLEVRKQYQFTITNRFAA
jgi:hypothetical protein